LCTLLHGDIIGNVPSDIQIFCNGMRSECLEAEFLGSGYFVWKKDSL